MSLPEVPSHTRSRTHSNRRPTTISVGAADRKGNYMKKKKRFRLVSKEDEEEEEKSVGSYRGGRV